MIINLKLESWAEIGAMTREDAMSQGQETKIRERAYEIWEEAGMPKGARRSIGCRPRR